MKEYKIVEVTVVVKTADGEVLHLTAARVIESSGRMLAAMAELRARAKIKSAQQARILDELTSYKKPTRRTKWGLGGKT